MLNLPKSTGVSLQLYKKDILQNFEGTQKQKDAFNNAIQSLKIVNEISSRSLPVAPSSNINGIFVVDAALKRPDIKPDTIELIFRLIPQHIILMLHYEDSIRLAVHHTRTFMTDWLPVDYNLAIAGLSIDEIWNHIVEAIGGFRIADNRRLDEQIEIESKIQMLAAQIEKLEAKKRNTRTPRMKYELHQRIQVLTEELEALKRK